jgi:hypothetical protein
MMTELDALRAQLKQLLLKHNLPIEPEPEPEPEPEIAVEESTQSPTEEKSNVNVANDQNENNDQQLLRRLTENDNKESHDQQHNITTNFDSNQQNQQSSSSIIIESKPDQNLLRSEQQTSETIAESQQHLETSDSDLFQGLSIESKNSNEECRNIPNQQNESSSQPNQIESKSKRLEECRVLLSELEKQLTDACDKEDYETAGMFFCSIRSLLNIPK